MIGVGLNVSTTADELPVDTATSLALPAPPDVDRTALLAAVLDAFERWYARWPAEPSAARRPRYRARARPSAGRCG